MIAQYEVISCIGVTVDDSPYARTDMSTMVGLQRKLEAELRSVIGLGFKVKLVEPKGIERSEGKAKRVIDKRKI